MDPLAIALEKVDFLRPDCVTDNSSILTLKNLVFEPLLGWDDGFAKPALFSRWTHSADGRRWEFFIRPDAVFHDGKTCTPADILSVIDSLLQSVDTFGMKWSYARYLENARMTASSGQSIIVENPEPIADILDIFSEFYISRLASDGGATLGTGPYRVVDFVPQAYAALERTDTSAGAGPSRIMLRAVHSAEERWRLLQDGSIDAAIHLDHMEHPPAEDPRFYWGQRLSPLSVMAYLNCAQGSFVSPAARLAANLAVNKQELVRIVFHGFAEAASTIVSPAHLGMRSAALQPISHDLARARALLDKVGGARVITLRAPTVMPERAPNIARFIADALADVGFEAAIDIEPNRPEYARQVGRKEIGDLALFDSSPHSTYRVLNDKISSTTKAVWWQGYDNLAVERMIRDANGAVESTAREAAYAACLRELQADPPWLYLVHPINLFAAKSGTPRLELTSKGTLRVG